MTERLRIVLFVNSLKTFYWHRQPLAERLIKEGHEVLIITSKDEKLKPGLAFNFKFISLNRRGLNPLQEVRSIIEVIEIFLQFKPHIIHNFTVKCVIYGSLSSIFTGSVKVINTITGLGSAFIKDNILSSFIRTLYQIVVCASNSEVIFQNIDDYDYFKKYRIVPLKRSHLVLGSGVDLTPYLIPKSDKSYEIPNILFASRLLRDKGIVEFVEAIRILQGKNLLFTCEVAGDVDPGNPSSLTTNEFHELIKDLKISWNGYADDMLPLIIDSHIICLPSYREGTPMILLEAAAASKGIVATDVPGCRNVVIHEKTGLLAKARDSYDLSQQLERMLLDPILRQELGQAARKHVENSFERNLIISQILNIYYAKKV